MFFTHRKHSDPTVGCEDLYAIFLPRYIAEQNNNKNLFINISKRNNAVAIKQLRMKIVGFNIKIALDPDNIYIATLFRDLDTVKQTLEHIRIYVPNAFAFDESIDLLKIPCTHKTI